MGNKQNKSRSRKRRFAGNQHAVENVNKPRPEPNPIIDSPSPALNNGCFTLERELRARNNKEEDDKNNAFIPVSVGLLANFISSHMRCLECCEFSIYCQLLDDKKDGFCHKILFRCSSVDCGWSTIFTSSDEVKEGNGAGCKEINLRMASFARSIGRGWGALNNFSSYVNCPPPMSQSAYQNILKKVHSSSKLVAIESMKEAAEEVREKALLKDTRSSIEPMNPIDCAVSVDGTWQRRGHASHHGVVSAISVQTGKCVDTEILSNYCKSCEHWEGRAGTEEYDKWKVKHLCNINHKGSANAMESVGVSRIFSRSVLEPRCLRYTEFLGDGDCASYKKVVELDPYEGREIVKLECVGHVQKRVGSRLRRLKNSNKSTKLADGKGLTGKGRLTDKIIDTMQNFYGLAIRQNAGNLEAMSQAVSAILPHVASTDANPMHDNCPESWCQFKSSTGYKHKHGLPQCIVEFIKPIFDDLSSPDLLQKCLHGKTQNRNECLNKLIWDRCSKEYFVEKNVVEEGVYSAVSFFNNGAQSVLDYYSVLGINPGYFTTQLCHLRDNARANSSIVKSSEPARKRRKVLRAIKKGFQDKATEAERDLYNPGGH
ncbi:hypothetical protein RRG08_063729 [Elysia crispata]|uniref:Mutator-like transposase domain-containing protein n=1 Tax=Elysia crispata TaxID=231223 RepID=A0AAE0ZWH9_9GAST|nr:hypothetical protein RRG08_063729 [Elysia crispata]